MRTLLSASILASLTVGSGISAFTVPVAFTSKTSVGRSESPRETTALSLSSGRDENGFNPNALGKAVAAALLSAALWTSPMSTSIPLSGHFLSSGNVAIAKEMASGSGSRVNKDAESLLRYGLPINNKDVRKLQVDIENIYYDTASKRIKPAMDGVRKVRQALKQNAGKLTPSCRDAGKCNDIIASMTETLEPLDAALQDASDKMFGSEQERTAIDKAYAFHFKLQRQLSELEEQMVPAGYITPVPDDYNGLPQLRGRATVEFVLKKPDGSPFDVEGVLSKEAKLKMVIDGYNAPVTGGNFVELVKNGFYNKMAIQRSDGFVVQTGDPEGEAEGYVATPSKSVGAGKHGERLIPLEISIRGDKGPFYESTMEDEGRGGQATVLPFSSYGAMGWAREEYDPNSGSSQFFWLLFDSDLTPAGKNVLDGRYPCFGYVVEGADFLRDVKEGDIITSAKVTSGLENLVPGKA